MDLTLVEAWLGRQLPDLYVACGYFYSICVGKWSIDPVMQTLAETFKPGAGKDAHRQRSSMLGTIERTLYTTSWYFNKPEFLAIWLALKVAGQWKGWSEDRIEDGYLIPGRAPLTSFLIGTGLSVGYGVLGGALIQLLNKSWIEALIVAGAVTGATFYLRQWAEQIRRTLPPTRQEPPMNETHGVGATVESPTAGNSKGFSN